MKKFFLFLCLCVPLGSAVSAQDFMLNCYTNKNIPTDVLKLDGIYILKNSKNCAQCFADIYNAIVIDSTIGKLKINFISHVDSSVFARKSEESKLKASFSKVGGYYFDYQQEGEPYGYSEYMRPNSLLYRLKIDVTPAVLVVKDKHFALVKYSELFESKKNIKATILQKLESLR